jgi:hypothetical protein
MAMGEGGVRTLPEKEAIAAKRQELSNGNAIEAAMLERDASRAIRYRTLDVGEIQSLGAG